MKGSWKKLLAEYGASLAGGVVGGGIAYLLGEAALRLVADASNDWVAAFLALVSITLLCFGVAIGAGEPVYRLARRDKPDWGKRARKQLWKGGFLGAPAVIALLSLMEMDWANVVETSGPILRVPLFAISMIQYALTSPLRLIVDVMDIPAEVPMVLAIPVGALMVRWFGRREHMLDENPIEEFAQHDSAQRAR